MEEEAEFEEADYCRFYCETSIGRRCILVGLNEWRSREYSLVSYCSSGGRGCPVMVNYLRANPTGGRGGKEGLCDFFPD